MTKKFTGIFSVKKTSAFVFGLALACCALLVSQDNAFADIEWSGLYRIEGHSVKNSELSGKRDIDYGLQHLILRPKIIAADGLTIHGQFNILNSNDYPNSQLGQFWGSGVRNTAPSAGTANTSPSSTNDSNALSQNQATDTIQVNHLYLTYTQEHGQLIVGRAPLHFGLGMTHNAGRGLFDHWFDNRDMVGYKVILGNLWVFPMLGKPSEGGLNLNDDVNDYMIQIQYSSPESEVELGGFYQLRRTGDQGSDAVSGEPNGQADDFPLGGANSTPTRRMNTKRASIYVKRDSSKFKFGLEATFESGESGVEVGGSNITWGGFGVATEFDYRFENSFDVALKAGIASGDDPSTKAKFEGFIFDRNYDLGMLLFNRPLGRADFLRTRLLTGSVNNPSNEGNLNRINQPDVEAISNVIYLAPSVSYKLSDQISFSALLVTGFLQENPLVGTGTGNNLGYEVNLSATYSPRKGIMWINQAGILFPGDAWAGGNQFETQSAFGFTTKAAISF